MGVRMLLPPTYDPESPAARQAAKACASVGANIPGAGPRGGRGHHPADRGIATGFGDIWRSERRECLTGAVAALIGPPNG